MECGPGYDIERDTGIKLVSNPSLRILSLQRLQAITAFERNRRTLGAVTAATLALASGTLMYVKERSPSRPLSAVTVSMNTCNKLCLTRDLGRSPLLAPLESATSRATASSTTLHPTPATTRPPIAPPSTLPILKADKAPPSSVGPAPIQVVSAAALQAARYDIAWPQCPYYANPSSVPSYAPTSPASIVEITRGQPDKPVSECFKQEANYQGSSHQFYVMAGSRGPDGYTYGYNSMQASLGNLSSANYPAGIWLDVETGSNAQGQSLWAGPASTNIAAIKGFLQAVRDAGQASHGNVYMAGIYSNQNFMRQITNSVIWPENVPMWLPTGTADASHVAQDCASDQKTKAFTEGPLELLQYQKVLPDGHNTIDVDDGCP